MHIKIELPKDVALLLANQVTTVSVIGPKNNTCYGTVATLYGREVFSMSMMNVANDELGQALQMITELARQYVHSQDWDGRGLEIQMDNLPTLMPVNLSQSIVARTAISASTEPRKDYVCELQVGRYPDKGYLLFIM